MLTIDRSQMMWELKYRPGKLSECILPKADKEIFEGIIKKGVVPNLILVSSSPGTGKTTLARVLCAETDSDMLFVKGSDCRIDFIRNDLTRFASSKSIEGRRKVIVIDEYDSNGVAEGQRYMRSFIDAYSSNCSVVITVNDIDGVITPLQSRCRVIKFGEATSDDRQSMMKEMIIRSMAICEKEEVKVEELKVIAALVKQNFPDFRKTINQLDLYSQNGVIDAGILSIITNNRTSIDDVIEALKNKDVKTLRALAPRHSNDFSNFVQKLADELYTKLPPVSIVRMYEIVGESNQYFGLAANIEVHLAYLFIQLAVEMQWL
ncbi:clamp loader of DNA polymerase [Pectobacterium bacteriophage PM2]|uniref:Sliding-clamp-loader large subunit n=1 Tax=Pectobacterium bacteriophage PM2 TaxID=1429794 RepID=A0A0A0Q0I6_9CAUD|nr:clamp loader of DNA polymerase [Pectobacterium bacteriophage PM2]AHY25018.1 clamp loader subunit, DNA polymerase accessory protein [Pectobacterium bacteriophage PM2]